MNGNMASLAGLDQGLRLRQSGFDVVIGECEPMQMRTVGETDFDLQKDARCHAVDEAMRSDTPISLTSISRTVSSVLGEPADEFLKRFTVERNELDSKTENSAVLPCLLAV